MKCLEDKETAFKVLSELLSDFSTILAIARTTNNEILQTDIFVWAGFLPNKKKKKIHEALITNKYIKNNMIKLIVESGEDYKIHCSAQRHSNISVDTLKILVDKYPSSFCADGSRNNFRHKIYADTVSHTACTTELMKYVLTISKNDEKTENLVADMISLNPNTTAEILLKIFPKTVPINLYSKEIIRLRHILSHKNINKEIIEEALSLNVSKIVKDEIVDNILRNPAIDNDAANMIYILTGKQRGNRK